MKKHLAAILSCFTVAAVVGCLGSGGTLTGGGTGTTTTGGGTTIPVTMENMVYSPQVVTAHAGDVIQWTNKESLPHTVTSDSGQSGLDSSGQFPNGIPTDGVFQWQVPENAMIGTNYFYHCEFHGAAGDGSSLGIGMAGEITVN